MPEGDTVAPKSLESSTDAHPDVVLARLRSGTIQFGSLGGHNAGACLVCRERGGGAWLLTQYPNND
jgi:hypothetical protein